MKNKKILLATVCLIAGIVTLIYFFRNTIFSGYNIIMQYIKNPDSFKTLITSYGSKGVLIFLLFQIVQVVIAFIPGEAVQFLGGIVYGPILGIIYSLIGIFIGEIIAFYIARFIGQNMISRFISFDKIKRFEKQINSTRSGIIMFVLFLIPGFSKDALTYFAGFSQINPCKFFAISMIGRLPALSASIILGHSYLNRDYKSIVLVIGGLLLFGAAGYAMKKTLDTIKAK